MSTKIIGIGEVLWDLLPAGRQLGGAPANFAYHARELGARAAWRMRVGVDQENAFFELMPAEDAQVDELLAVLSAALARLNPRGRRPIQAHQSQLDDPGSLAAHAALQGLGFASLRTLAHMLATVTRS